MDFGLSQLLTVFMPFIPKSFLYTLFPVKLDFFSRRSLSFRFFDFFMILLTDAWAACSSMLLQYFCLLYKGVFLVSTLLFLSADF
jgi:hypothetical protein